MFTRNRCLKNFFTKTKQIIKIKWFRDSGINIHYGEIFSIRQICQNQTSDIKKWRIFLRNTINREDLFNKPRGGYRIEISLTGNSDA